MAISLVQQQRPMLQQRMILAPQIIQSIEILQLPLMALQERIDQELLENPLLEVEEAEAVEDTDRPDSPEDRKAEDRVEEGEDFAKLDNLSDDFQDYFWQATPRANPGDKDEKLEALANTPGRPPALRDYLVEQIQYLDVEPEPRRILEYLISNLRPDGYLDGELEDIVKTLNPPPAPGDAEKALSTLQTLDPPGVGARNLRECLLLQLRAAGGAHPLVERIVRDCLEDVQMNRFPKIKQETGATLEEIKEAVEAIKRLEPAPGRRYDTDAAPYIVPDVNIDYIDGRYEVMLNDSVMPRLRVSSMYRDLTQGAAAGKEAKDYIRQKIDSARWFIDSIQQRRQTLLKIAQEIVRAQHDFFERGLGHLKPLKMQDVADASSVHVTTVSRAIRGKYVQTPRGVYPFKFFFAGGVQNADGDSESFNAVRQRIQTLVNNEDKKEPLSDDQIVKILEEQGITIARRTVTKYRKALNIPSSRQRREY